MKLDETLPHLRASAAIFADVQADGMRHQIEAEIKKEDKANKKPSIIKKLTYRNKTSSHPFMKRNIFPPFHTDARYFHLKRNSPPKVVLI